MKGGVRTMTTHKKEIPKGTIFLDYIAFVKQSSLSSSFAVTTAEQNQTLNEGND